MSDKDYAAFPLYVERGDERNTSGMTLRDYFAAKAMQGVFASEKHTDANDDVLSCSIDWYSSIADHAYQMADAMMKARKA